jgi:uncharacterized protein (TIGR02231 family)
MKKLCLLALIFFGYHYTSAQTDKPVDSKITDVTVFLNKAQITREVKTRVDPGKTNIILTGLTSQLDQQSIQVKGNGSFIILGIAHQQNYLSEFNMPRSLKILKDSIDYLQRQVILEQSQKEILNKEEQMLLSNQKIGGANQNLSVAELKAMADFYRARLSDIVTSRMKQDEKIKRINDRIVKLQRQSAEQNDLYNRNTSEIVVRISAEAATSVELDINYLVANAGWIPVYDLRAKDTKSPVQLNYKANVFQSSGEEWKNVNLTLSTANPSLGGLKPELSSWLLNFEYPYMQRDKSRLAATGAVHRGPPIAEEALKAADVEEDSEQPAKSVSEYTTSIQTALNTEFSIQLPYTVSSSNRPTLVDIKNHEMKADYQYSVAPKLDMDAFLMARATGWEEFNLLPGEANIFFEGTFVAKTFIDPNNVNDTLAISLGRDKRVVVKREKQKDFTSKKFIGTNKRESYAYEISVRNTKSEPIKITIEDQVPISQNSAIEITVSDVGGAKHNKNTGKLIWEMTLAPSETKKAAFKFEVKYPKDQIIPML